MASSLAACWGQHWTSQAGALPWAAPTFQPLSAKPTACRLDSQWAAWSSKDELTLNVCKSCWNLIMYPSRIFWTVDLNWFKWHLSLNLCNNDKAFSSKCKMKHFLVTCWSLQQICLFRELLLALQFMCFVSILASFYYGTDDAFVLLLNSIIHFSPSSTMSWINALAHENDIIQPKIFQPRYFNCMRMLLYEAAKESLYIYVMWLPTSTAMGTEGL